MNQKEALHPNDIKFGRRYKEDATGTIFAVVDVTSTGVLLLEYAPGERTSSVDVASDGYGNLGLVPKFAPKTGSREELLHVSFAELPDQYTNMGVLDTASFLLYVQAAFYERHHTGTDPLFQAVLTSLRRAHVVSAEENVLLQQVYPNLALLPLPVRVGLCRLAQGQMVVAIKFVRTILKRSELGATKRALDVLMTSEDVANHSDLNMVGSFDDRVNQFADLLLEHRLEVNKAFGLHEAADPSIVFMNTLMR